MHATDITYESLAKAFNQPLAYHQETLNRMGKMIHRWSDIEKQNEEQRTARMRMALFPADAEVLFTDTEMWVVRVGEKGPREQGMRMCMCEMMTRG